MPSRRSKPADSVVLGISPDKPEDNKKWKIAENLPYDLLSDEDHSNLEAWGAWGEKSMYGNTYEGVIRSHWIIDENGIVLDEQIKISPANSIKEGLKALGL